MQSSIMKLSDSTRTHRHLYTCSVCSGLTASCPHGIHLSARHESSSPAFHSIQDAILSCIHASKLQSRPMSSDCDAKLFSNTPLLIR
jgi:hypothetical protein